MSTATVNNMCQHDATIDGFAFLDVALPYVAWAAYRGVLITPQRVQAPGARFVSWWLANGLRYRAHLERELALERVREQQFPNRISRLVGMFCFLDRDSADRAVEWGNHFRLENLAELSLSEATGRDRLDANWISCAGDTTGCRDVDWMQRYWRGEACPHDEPLWETLVEGKVAVLGTTLRERAHEVVKAHWPDSLMFLEISRLGAWIGSDIGSINVLMTEKEEEFEFRFLLDMRNANDAGFLERLNELMASGHPVNWADIRPHYEQGNFGRTPDMTPYQFSCPRESGLP